MDIRDKLSLKSRIEDLDVLLEEPFEIDSEKDFPLMYVINYNIRMKHRFDLLRKLNLSEKERDKLQYLASYDYSPSYKIVLSYLFHNLAEEKVFPDSLENIKKFREGILFSMQGISLVEKNIDPKTSEKIWAEFSRYPKLKQDFHSAVEKLRDSSEKDKLFEIMDHTREKLEKKKNTFQRGCPGITYRNPGLDYSPKSVSKGLWQNIQLRGMHDFSVAIQNFDYCLR